MTAPILLGSNALGGGVGGGATDHGALTGLGDNDHPQYALATGTAADLADSDTVYVPASATSALLISTIEAAANCTVVLEGDIYTLSANLTVPNSVSIDGRSATINFTGNYTIKFPSRDQGTFVRDLLLNGASVATNPLYVGVAQSTSLPVTWTRAGNVVTVTFPEPHKLAAAEAVTVSATTNAGLPNGAATIASAPTTTTITITSAGTGTLTGQTATIDTAGANTEWYANAGSKTYFENIMVTAVGTAGSGMIFSNLQNSTLVNLRVVGASLATNGIVFDNGCKNIHCYGVWASSVNGPGLLLTTSLGDQRTSKIYFYGGLSENSGDVARGMVELGDCEKVSFINYSLNPGGAKGYRLVASGNRDTDADGVGNGTRMPANIFIDGGQVQGASDAISVEGICTTLHVAGAVLGATTSVYNVTNSAARILVTRDNFSETAATVFVGSGGAVEADVMDRYKKDSELPASVGSALAYQAHPTAGATEALTVTSGGESFHRVEFNVASCAISPSGLVAGVPSKLTVELVQDATGGRLATWAGGGLTYVWPGGNAPVLKTAANAVDVVDLWCHDGARVYGFHRQDPKMTYATLGSLNLTGTVTFEPGIESVVHAVLARAITPFTTTFTFSAGRTISGQPSVVRMRLVQDATGSRLAAWPGTITWMGGSAPVLQTAANAEDWIWIVTLDGGTSFIGWHQNEAELTPAANNDTSPDTTTTPGSVYFDLNPLVRAQAQGLGSKTVASGRQVTTYVRLATIAAFPACTYNNSINGSGATLTGNANGALADVDGTVVAVNDRILYRSAADADKEQNGPYVVTQLGTAGTPFILTRLDLGDEAENYVSGVELRVFEGAQLAGTRWRAQGTITMGTTSIYWIRIPDRPPTPLGVYLGNNREAKNYVEDFDKFSTALVLADTGKVIPGSPCVTALAGAGAQITQLGNDSASTTTDGVAKFETGSTTDGSAAVKFGHSIPSFSAERFYQGAMRFRVPTASAATDLFVIRSGLMDIAAWPYQGIYLCVPQSATELGFANQNVQGITHKNNGAQTLQNWTRAASGTTVTVTVTAHGLTVGDGIVIGATTSAAALPNTTALGLPYYVQTVVDANTFTITGLNSGATPTSGTATVSRLTRTVTDLGITTANLATHQKVGWDYDPVTKAVRWWAGAAAAPIATVTTNIPDAAFMGFWTGIYKKGGSTGTTSLAAHVDLVVATLSDTRTFNNFIR